MNVNVPLLIVTQHDSEKGLDYDSYGMRWDWWGATWDVHFLSTRATPG
jgi:hypothetical protein